MTPIVIAVIARILCNGASNVYQKRLTGSGIEPFLVNLVSYGGLSVIGMSFLFADRPAELPTRYWVFSILSGVTGAFGNGFLVKSLEKGELSVIGPVNAYKPLVGMIASFVLTREWPNAYGIVGVALIIMGSYYVLDSTEERFGWALLRNRSIRHRIAALLLTGLQAVIDREVVLASNLRLSFFSWSFFGFLFTFIIWKSMGRGTIRSGWIALNRHRTDFLMLTLCIGAMVFATNFTFSMMPVGEALALFQLSGILTVYWGHRFFREGGLARKTIGATIMAAGAALILLHR